MITYQVERIRSTTPVMAKAKDGSQEDTGYSMPVETDTLNQVELEDDWLNPEDALKAVGSDFGSVKEMDSGTVFVVTSDSRFILTPVSKKDLLRRGWRQVDGRVSPY